MGRLETKTYLVDTSVLVDSLRGSKEAISWLVDNCSASVLPSVVVLELLAPSLSKTARRRVMLQVAPFELVNPNSHDWSRARTTYKNWDPQHKKPGIADLIIGQTAIGLGLKVATKNVKDFENFCEVIEPY